MQSDFAVVSLAGHEEIARLCVADAILVEAVELHGGALFVAAAREWTMRDGRHDVPQGAWLVVPEKHQATLEMLFVAARKQARGADYSDARHGCGDAKPASKPLKPGASVRYQPGKRTW